jgi:hypothetical protein
MRFKQFLNEEIDFKNLDEILAKIKGECGLFLHEADGLPLLRGFGSRTKYPQNAGSFQEMPTNRYPRDSNPGFNFMFNLGIEEAFGVHEIRKNSLFATGSLDQSYEYGQPHFIFPVGQVKLLCAPYINDSFFAEQQIYDRISKNLPAIENERPPLSYRQLELIFSDMSLKFSVEKILSGNKSLDEIIKESYDHVLSIKVENIPTGKEFLAAINKTFTDLYVKSDIVAAIKSQTEILIYEANGFYAIPVWNIKHLAADNGMTDDDIENLKIYDLYEILLTEMNKQ